MGVLEIVFSFIFVMSIVSIPILAILKRKPKIDRRELDELSRKVSELELKLLERGNEVHELRKELSFFGRLLEERKDK